MREVWLVHPTDRVVIVYTVGADCCYGKPAIHETTGTLAPGLFPDLTIEWDWVFLAAPADGTHPLPFSSTKDFS